MDRNVKVFIQTDVYHAICMAHEALGNDAKEHVKHLIKVCSESFEISELEILDVLNDLMKKEKSKPKYLKDWYSEK